MKKKQHKNNIGEELHRISGKHFHRSMGKKLHSCRGKAGWTFTKGKALTATQVKVLKVLCSTDKVHMGPGVDADR